MKQAKLLFLLIAALAFASCRPTARQAVGYPAPRHRRQKPLTNRLLYTEDTKTSIRLYCCGDDK